MINAKLNAVGTLDYIDAALKYSNGLDDVENIYDEVKAAAERGVISGFKAISGDFVSGSMSEIEAKEKSVMKVHKHLKAFVEKWS